MCNPFSRPLHKPSATYLPLSVSSYPFPLNDHFILGQISFFVFFLNQKKYLCLYILPYPESTVDSLSLNRRACPCSRPFSTESTYPAFYRESFGSPLLFFSSSIKQTNKKHIALLEINFGKVTYIAVCVFKRPLFFFFSVCGQCFS